MRRERITPGRFLQQRVLDPNDITQEALAVAMRVSRLTVNEIVNDRRTITTEMALKLERATRVSAEMWLNLQRNIVLARTRASMAVTLREIKPVTRKRYFTDVKAEDLSRYVQHE